VFYPSYPKEITFYLRENGFRFELLVLCGGDGTLNEAINGLMNLIDKPKLLYIPSGTVNDVSKALKLNKKDIYAFFLFYK
jgi:diacylglycerol kinase family enzyme